MGSFFLRPFFILVHLIGHNLTIGVLLVSILLLLIPYLLGARPSRALWRWAPLLGLLILIFTLPDKFLLINGIWERFIAIAYVFFLFTFEPPKLNQSALHLALLVPILWVSNTARLMITYDRSLDDFRSLLAAIPKDQRILGLTEDTTGPVHPFAYMHLFTWYSTLTCGVCDFNFATYYPMIVRYRAGAEAPPSTGFYQASVSDPWSFVVVRSSNDPTEHYFSERTPGELVFHQGKWWLFRKDFTPIDMSNAENHR